mmetsp:Transcript_16063/g.34733  ORF Transcript_16063/g.34733 Transcript_16063/m.34733 type:complete len:345 (+) Transcript_16063:141-1175(+)|eukprot:CAMPEP_0172323686 /NCGR_PEP_ID=MMETSP1058-20130122/49429_1 /TAXON_ID=83371 /ORGANISM="Detonula confervacea, Strain CCMP 353" /LENGTH=344 /DNA_ID=CAMNT_0013039763 /DNA_START=59 /DNA_END=1093 /DNA_ORIENTATION=-
MGRRNRSKKDSWEDDNSGEEDDYGLERAEKKWLMHRQESKRQKTEDNEVPSTDGGKSKSANDPIVQQDKSKDDESRQHNSTKKDDANTPEEDKVERLKLKKQRQKEKQREKKAQRQAKRQKPEVHEAPSTGDGKSKSANETDPIAPQDKSKDESPQNNIPKKNTPEEDKIERMKLKKQRQKERQREKKAEAASAAEAKKQRRVESEKTLKNKQKQEREKKAKMKEQQTQQARLQFKTLGKGVKYQDSVIGKGPTVQHRKKVIVSYTLRSKSHTTGKILDSSNSFGFRLGKSEVIKGWDIGLQDMRVGGTRLLVVAPSAGYGNKDVGAGQGADLYFQIELLHVAP